jgi:hypothetical protein
MKKILFGLLIFVSFLNSADVNKQQISPTIGDFKALLLDSFSLGLEHKNMPILSGLSSNQKHTVSVGHSLGKKIRSNLCGCFWADISYMEEIFPDYKKARGNAKNKILQADLLSILLQGSFSRDLDKLEYKVIEVEGFLMNPSV